MLIKPAGECGVTLIELLVTLTVAAILTGIAVPSFISTIRSNRLTTNINELVTALNLARSEAVKRGEIVVVRKNGSEWENGWKVFVDIDRSSPSSDMNTYQSANNCESGKDCLLREFPALRSGFTLRGSNNVSNYIQFRPSGESNVSGTFVLCDNSDGDAATVAPQAYTSRVVIVNTIGRVRVAKDTDTTKDGIPNLDTSGTPNIDTCDPA